MSAIRDMKHNLVLRVIIAALIVLAAGVAIVAWAKSTDSSLINNFHDCRHAGGIVAESYPEQCFINGKSFTNPDQASNTPADSYIGLGEYEAFDKAKSESKPARVVERDGESLPITMDYAPGRLNFYIRDDKIIKVEIEGEN